MKKYLFLLISIFIINYAQAAPGDTTWVQANNVQLSIDNHNYDTAITFPSGSTTYRKVYMIFTLGKYMCPGYTYGSGSVPYCGDWDYTIQNYIMTPGGDTLELSRLITPYANNGAPRTPWTWTQHYMYDVTDYVSKLQGSATMRLYFSGWSPGFTANIRFAFVEGTPDRNVLAIHRLWNGSFSYGDPSNPINTHFPALTETAASDVKSSTLRFTVTGHGADNNNCCEFMSHNYQVSLNSSQIANTTIWRDNCGANELYPQSGTWMLQRANWCPGAMVYPIYHPLTGITGGANYNVDIQFDAYTGAGSFGSYTTEAHLIDYGAMNKTLDASIEDIIAPTADENHFRENPLSNTPTINVKNTGSTTITSMEVACSVDGGALSYFNWTGSLASLHDTDIVFPENWFVRQASGTSGSHTFTANIVQVNGNTGDDDTTNNVMHSSFIGAPKWPVTFLVTMRTNSEGDISGNSETTWQIFDTYGNVVAQRLVSGLNTTYVDTVTLGPATYKLVVSDGGCDGLSWWGFASEGITSGSFSVRKVGSTLLPLNGDPTGSYANDFGCGFTQYFTTDWPTSVNNVTAGSLGIEAYPNPASSTVNIDITEAGSQQIKGTIKLIDVMGRVAATINCNDAHQVVDVSALSSGVYTVLYINDATGNKLQTRLLITK